MNQFAQCFGNGRMGHGRKLGQPVQDGFSMAPVSDAEQGLTKTKLLIVEVLLMATCQKSVKRYCT